MAKQEVDQKFNPFAKFDEKPSLADEDNLEISFSRSSLNSAAYKKITISSDLPELKPYDAHKQQDEHKSNIDSSAALKH